MINVLVAITTIATLANVVSSFNTNRDEELNEISNSLDNWFIVFEDVTENSSFSPNNRNIITTVEPLETVTDPDPLSVIWYLGAFGGLVAFFLVVSFSEWCCASKHLYRRHTLAAPYLTGTYSTESHTPDTPPPPYHLFAPPPYAEAAITYYEKSQQAVTNTVETTGTNITQSTEQPPPIYIIPVHHQQNCTASTITANNNTRLTAAQLALLPPPPPYPAILTPSVMASTTMDLSQQTQMASVPT